MKTVNKEVSKVTGEPVCASDGQMTRSDNEASRRSSPVNLGMGEFSPRAGANTKGPYIVKGSEYGGKMGKMGKMKGDYDDM